MAGGRRAAIVVALGALGAVAGLLALRDPAPPLAVDGPEGRRPPNVLVVLLDDVGAELVGVYGQPEAAATPTIDGLAARGVRFDHAWATPLCSPSRAALLTGRHPRHVGIGGALSLAPGTVDLPEEAATVAELLRDRAPDRWGTAWVGKWHLTAMDDDPAHAPQRQGFDRFVGSAGNFTAAHATDRKAQAYAGWERLVDGRSKRAKTHATIRTVSDARDVIRRLEEPWFVVLALHAAHTPWHDPPGTVTVAKDPGRAAAQIRAMITHADAELGRLLGTLDPEVRARTLVAVTADNGSTDNAGRGPFAGLQGKSRVTELGVHVPLVVAGPGVAVGASDALVSLVDLPATVLHLAGVDPEDPALALDGQSLVPALLDPAGGEVHETLFAEVFVPDGAGPFTRHDLAVRDAAWRMVRTLDGPDRLWRIGDAMVEGKPVDPASDPEAAAAARRLGAVLDRMGRPGSIPSTRPPAGGS